MKTYGTGRGVSAFCKRALEHRRLAVWLAAGAVLVMLPALKLGLVADDLPQRVVALRADQLPPQASEMGNPADSGSLRIVLRDFFFNMEPEKMVMMKHYGVFPWWTPADMKLGLWRPVTAFTHWLDYRLFPDSPVVMHAENIAWFAAIVVLVTIVYRKLMGAGWAGRAGGADVPAGWEHVLPGGVCGEPRVYHVAVLRAIVPVSTSAMADGEIANRIGAVVVVFGIGGVCE